MLLFLNDIAGSEILLILVFILIFFGSKSIPGIARTMGRTIRQIQDASSEIQSEIKKSSAEMKSDLNLEGLMRDTAAEVRQPLDQMASDLDNAVKYTPPRKSTHLENTKTEEPITRVEIPKMDSEAERTVTESTPTVEKVNQKKENQEG